MTKLVIDFYESLQLTSFIADFYKIFISDEINQEFV